jgi:L-alanine-DL-glutamate epimerase-like enolase superfamily enzyme
MKMRLGRDAAYDRHAVEAVTKALGGKARLAVDGTHRYTEEAAAEFARYLSNHDNAWFEEPFPPEDIDAYARLRARVEVPVSAGENEFGVQGFRELFRAGAVDIAQPDVARSGGITECLRVEACRAAWSEGCDSHLERRCSSPPTLTWSRRWTTDGGRGRPHGMPVHGRMLLERLTFETASSTSSRPGLGVAVDPVMLCSRSREVGPSHRATTRTSFGPEATRPSHREPERLTDSRDDPNAR